MLLCLLLYVFVVTCNVVRLFAFFSEDRDVGAHELVGVDLAHGDAVNHLPRRHMINI